MLLYEIVRVKTRQQFRSLYKTLVETEHRNALGRHIRELRISHTMGFSRDAFESLPRLCPFLVIFDFDSRIWKNLRVSTTMEDWKHLRSLPQPLPSLQPRLKDYLLDKFGACFSEMTVHIEHRTQQDWLVLLEKMPKVEDLIIKGNDTHTTHGSPLISIAQLEKLHATKSALRSLSLRNINVYGDLPKDITLCTSMRKIELLSIADCLPLLLRYLTRKYAGLKSVYVEVEYDNLAVAQQKEITSALISLVTSHHQLEQFQVEQFRADQSILECFSPSTQALCVLHEYNAPILELSVDDNIGYWIATGIRYFHQTLSIVELRTARLKSIEEILLPLSMCPSLLQLSLEFYSDFYYQFDFGVNDILTYCKSIKTLKICAEKVSLGYGEHVRNLHNLEALIITTSDIDSDVLAYISDCCPRLSSLSCIYHSTAYIRDITFDMPKSRLDYLYFNCPDDRQTRTHIGKEAKTLRIYERFRCQELDQMVPCGVSIFKEA
ncbi:hypothetical protein DFQ30_008664 [Apophysomyces sp. BC1015]|nr:hypothetical protein DFQ30_008664 [Apophysomyces sp. BC1015]